PTASPLVPYTTLFRSGGDDGRPQSLLVADGRLRDVLRADDLIREPVHFLLLVPALVGIELEAERRGEHFRGELLGVVARDVFARSEEHTSELQSLRHL